MPFGMSARVSSCRGVASLFTWLALTQTVLWSSNCQSRQAQLKLGEYIRHYEPVTYNLKAVDDEFSQWQGDASDPNRVSFSMEIWGFGRVFRLLLSEDKDIFSPGTVFQAGHSDTFLYDTSHHVAGHVHGEADSHVHGFIVGGRFRGIIDVDHDKYHVEPALAHFDTPQSFHSIMYRERDVDHEKALGGRPLDIRKYAADQAEELRMSRSRARRQAETPISNVECILAVAGDHHFAQLVAKEEAISTTDVSGLRAAMTRVMALYIRDSNRILQATTFLDTSEKPEGIRLAIGTVQTYVTAEEMKRFNGGTTKLSEQFLGAESFLSEWAKNNWDSFCLAHIFTNREFDQGVLGLAFVTGVCQKYSKSRSQSSNTGMVTHSNSGSRIPTSIIKLVYTHEVGHNLGANHDPTSCVPTDAEGGKYIMYRNANDGSQANNRKFSSCSTSSISVQLKNKAFVARGGCFKPPSNGSFCSNRVREGEEEYDCGQPAQCREESFCCTDKCKLSAGNTCSPQQGPCCNSSTCQFVPQASNLSCSEAQECRQGLAVCNGTTSECPLASPKEDGIVCNSGRATCSNGDCVGSLCAHFNLSRCFCHSPHQCHVCCSYEGKCRTLSSLGQLTGTRTFNTTGLDLFLPPGSACNDFAGHCNFLNYCRQLSDTSALLDVHNFLFSASTYAIAYQWISDNWWAALLAGFGIVLVFFLVIRFCSYKTPQTVKIKASGAKRRSTAGQIPMSGRHQSDVSTLQFYDQRNSIISSAL